MVLLVTPFLSAERKIQLHEFGFGFSNYALNAFRVSLGE